MQLLPPIIPIQRRQAERPSIWFLTPVLNQRPSLFKDKRLKRSHIRRYKWLLDGGAFMKKRRYPGTVICGSHRQSDKLFNTSHIWRINRYRAKFQDFLSQIGDKSKSSRPVGSCYCSAELLLGWTIMNFFREINPSLISANLVELQNTRAAINVLLMFWQAKDLNTCI